MREIGLNVCVINYGNWNKWFYGLGDYLICFLVSNSCPSFIKKFKFGTDVLVWFQMLLLKLSLDDLNWEKLKRNHLFHKLSLNPKWKITLGENQTGQYLTNVWISDSTSFPEASLDSQLQEEKKTPGKRSCQHTMLPELSWCYYLWYPSKLNIIWEIGHLQRTVQARSQASYNSGPALPQITNYASKNCTTHYFLTHCKPGKFLFKK